MVSPDAFHQGQRALQERFDATRLADRIAELTWHDRFTDADRAFIERMDMFFLATADADGNLNCSYKGGDPGFVRITGDDELAFPSYDGNGTFMSTGNVLAHAKVGMLFVDFENQRRMRVNGTASIDFDDPLLGEYPEAQLIVRVRADVIFPNCPRYIHQMQRVERSPFVPRDGCETPQPGWKQQFADVLPSSQKPEAPPA